MVVFSGFGKNKNKNKKQKNKKNKTNKQTKSPENGLPAKVYHNLAHVFLTELCNETLHDETCT